MIDLWMQIEGTKVIFIMNFSVLDFFKFASRMLHIAQILVLTFKIFRGRRGAAYSWTLVEISFFFPLAIPGSGASAYDQQSMHAHALGKARQY